MTSDYLKKIDPDKGIFKGFKEIFSYKDLLYFMSKREVSVLYKQTVLGFLWAIIRPLFSMIIFSLIFGNLAKIPSDGIPYPLFSYCALVPWTYFSTSLNKSTQSLITSSSIFTKVYFPRLILPLAPIFSSLIDFFIALFIVFFMMFYYDITFSLSLLWVPLLVFKMMITAAGIGMWLSAMALQYRDIRHAVVFFVQLLMYLAPVVWPISLFKERFGEFAFLLYGIYPMAGVIEGFRSSLLGINSMPWLLILTGLISSLFIFVTGLYYFQKKEKYFADVA